MLYAMLSGRLPFPVDDDAFYDALIRQVTKPIPPLGVEGIPPEAERLVRRALSKDPDERPSAAEMKEELARLV